MGFHFAFKQNMSQRHHLVSWKSVPAWLGDADTALNVTACILKSLASPTPRHRWDLLPEPLWRKQSQEIDYCRVARQSPRRPAVPLNSECSPK